MSIYSIILAGWSGTRLWPLSRKYYPKQFIKFEELWNISLFQMALIRASKISKKENILIVTNSDYKFHCITQGDEIWLKLNESQILIEPIAKNTLPAITFAMQNIEENSFWLIMSSDHIIEQEENFVKAVKLSLDKAKESIITFGIKPFCPHTWYWYIEAKKWKTKPYKVNNFKEKPDLKTANKFIEAGYYWNAWIFMFWKEIFFEELEKNSPDVYKAFFKNKSLENIFKNTPNISIDYWLLEKSKNIYLTPLQIYWNDLWSFDAINDYLKCKKYSNQDILEIDAKNNLILSENKDKKIAIIWLDNCIVVDTKDALLISKKWETQKIKQVVEKLSKEKSYLTDFWMTVYRPWWSYTVFEKWDWYKTKRLSVLPWKRLSLQVHKHRSEHWVIVSGTATVIKGNKEIIVKKWESVFIPAWTKHRLANNQKTDLHIIESQIWNYIEEDDTVSFADDFGRDQKRVGS